MSLHQMTILFQGDSITDGGRRRNEEASPELGYSYPSVIAEQISAARSDQMPAIINRGISGNRVSDLYARWNEDAISLKPDLISILIGVNDLWRIMNNLPEGATDRFERAYRHLLDETREVLPNAALVLMEPFILNVGAPAEKWDAWHEGISKYHRIVRELAAEYKTSFVPLQAAFEQAAQSGGPAEWLRDGVHPTEAGHRLIAEQWLSVVRSSGIANI